ncbi:unnamed protein product [Moneuplotes crassus]|uniref:RNase III domain-containing protein n=1 Tax=Euplotes crassus TaxID=5936 RepID=A0AAD1UKN5_EUPCR|nr:unnamed protein product [Moneuplotes crassus]
MSQQLKIGQNILSKHIWEQEAKFLKDIYYPRTEMKEVSNHQVDGKDKKALQSLANHLEHLGNQTDRFKSIIEDSQPMPEDDMPILHYLAHSEYIVNGFDANEEMTTIEVFTDKWDRYIKERQNKETNKECLKEEFLYQSNRMPELLTSKFQAVQNSKGEVRVKTYLTAFIPHKKIECQIENQCYKTVANSKMSCDSIVVYGILSPLCPGKIPDVKFFTNHLRSSTGFEYISQTIDEPLYIEDFGKVELFMKLLLRDIYKYNLNKIKNLSDDPMGPTDPSQGEAQEGLPNFKNYFFVPINMTKLVEHPEDIIDWDYIDMVLDIHHKGVANTTHNLYDIYQRFMSEDSGMSKQEGMEHFNAFVKDSIFIKADKPHCLYINLKVVEDLKQKDPIEFAEQLKINIGSKNFDSAYQLIDSGKVNASTVKFFRDYCSSKGKAQYLKYMNSPVVIADFIKNPNTLKLRFLPVDLAIRAKRKFYTEAKPPGVSGRPILSLHDVYPYYMNKEQWLHCCFLQILATHYERCSYVTELCNGVGLDVNCVDLYIATNTKATSAEINLEPLETYGDTVLKFAAAWISYEVFKNDPEAGENEICERRNCFITNKELFRVGVSLNLRRYLRTLDGDITNWVPPFTDLSLKYNPSKCFYVESKYTGKNIADCTEALIAAYMFKGGVKHALKFISKIGAVPLDKSGLLEMFPDSPSSFRIGNPKEFRVKINANFEEIFKEYCLRHLPSHSIIQNFKKSLRVKQIEPLGAAYKHMENYSHNDLTQVGQWDKVLEELESILDYKFVNIKYLKEALIHESYYSVHCSRSYGYIINYEKLEVLGDAVLDVIVNSSLAAFAMEKNVSPFEIHHSKSRLVNNELLCKIACFYGIHRFILSGLSTFTIPEDQIQDLFDEDAKASAEGKYGRQFFESLGSRSNTFWNHKTSSKSRKRNKSRRRKKANHYPVLNQKVVKPNFEKNTKAQCINSYLKDFEPNFVFCSDYEPFEELQHKIHNRYYEAPKIIPDVFEAILGAVFVDGGYNEVVRVLQHTLGPFVCMVAKYFDKIRKNPIEEFTLFCNSKGLTPKIETFKLGAIKEKNPYDSDCNQELGYPLEDQPEGKPLVHHKCVIIHKGNKQLSKSYGNTREQAKKNACALGFSLLREEFNLEKQDSKEGKKEPSNDQSSDECTYTHDSGDTSFDHSKMRGDGSDECMSEGSKDIY